MYIHKGMDVYIVISSIQGKGDFTHAIFDTLEKAKEFVFKTMHPHKYHASVLKYKMNAYELPKSGEVFMYDNWLHTYFDTTPIETIWPDIFNNK